MHAITWLLSVLWLFLRDVYRFAFHSKLEERIPDNTAAEMLQVDPEIKADVLHPTISKMWETENIPEKLTDAINKIISIIIHDRLSKVQEPILGKKKQGPIDYASITSIPYE